MKGTRLMRLNEQVNEGDKVDEVERAGKYRGQGC